MERTGKLCPTLPIQAIGNGLGTYARLLTTVSAGRAPVDYGRLGEDEALTFGICSELVLCFSSPG